MRYQGLQPLDDELQERHEERNRLLRETITFGEAVERYGVSRTALRRRLREGGYVAVMRGRYRITDIEAALKGIRA